MTTRPALIAICLLATAPALPAQEVRGSNGRFPVFGPSAEREAFFAAQEQERQQRLDEIRAEQEAAAQAARQRAEAEAAARRETPDETYLSRMPYYPVVICDRVRRDDPDEPGRHRRGARECRTIYVRTPQPYARYAPAPRGSLDLRFRNGDVSGRFRYAEPGLRLRFGFGED